MDYKVPKIGQLLVERMVIDDDQLVAALDAQRRCGRRLGEILLDKHLVSVDDLDGALLEQLRYKLAAVMLTVGASLLTPTTTAAADASRVMLIGSVAPTDVISVNSNAGYLQINLDADTGTAAVAEITEKSYGQTGYSMLLQAKSVAETGQPAFANYNGSQLPYTLLYNDQEVHFINGNATLADVPASNAGKHSTSRQLLVRSAHFGEVLADHYSDTLTLIIVPK